MPSWKKAGVQYSVHFSHLTGISPFQLLTLNSRVYDSSRTCNSRVYEVMGLLLLIFTKVLTVFQTIRKGLTAFGSKWSFSSEAAAEKGKLFPFFRKNLKALWHFPSKFTRETGEAEVFLKWRLREKGIGATLFARDLIPSAGSDSLKHVICRRGQQWEKFIRKTKELERPLGFSSRIFPEVAVKPRSERNRGRTCCDINASDSVFCGQSSLGYFYLKAELIHFVLFVYLVAS